MFPLQKFQDYITQNALLSSNGRVLLTVSGGIDSVFMVHLFKRSGYAFGIAHCNFNLRGEESMRDEAFVRMLALDMNVPFYISHFETKVYAAANGISTQMAARTLRYEWFESIRQAENYEAIAVAHHQTDTVETLLLNLTRGTGIAGLHGILPRRGHIIRPLLAFSRTEITQVVSEEQLGFVEDSSNNSDHYARNRIRLKVLPELKAINPNLEETFEQNIRRFAETEMVLQQAVLQLQRALLTEENGVVRIPLQKIRLLVPQKLLLYELLKPYHFSESVVADLLHSLDHQSGASFYSTVYRATLDRDELIITTFNPDQRQQVTSIHPQDVRVRFGHHQVQISSSDTIGFQKINEKAFVDTQKLIYPLILRYWQEGDKFMPLGMESYKKVSDFFIDEKVPLPLKDQIPMLVNGNGEMIWIAGMRQDNRYKVASATKKVTIFELKS